MMAVFLTVLAILAVLYCIGSYFFRFTLRRARTGSGKNDSLEPMSIVKDRAFFNREDRTLHEINSFDGLSLKGYFYDRGGDTTVIMCHSYKGSPEELSGIAEALFEKGFNILLPFNRAHGLSEGGYFTMGCRERLDLLGWADKLNALRPEGKIALFGWSMGANTVMGAVGEQLPENVICAVEDCGYENLYDQLKESAKTFMPGLPFTGLLVNVLDMYCRVFRGFPVRWPVRRCLERCEIPMLFIHGEADDFVPFDNLGICYEACASEKNKAAYPNAVHISSFASDPERYISEMNDFIKRYS